jgi:cell wall assembly regulator SMI1
MAVGYLRREPPASPEQIDALERRIGVPLPADYRAYLAAQNGGRLENNNEAAKTIFGLGELPDYTNMGDKLDTYAGRVPAWLLPVAQDEYGNLFAVSLRPRDNGSVWFWDHEEEADEGEPPTEDNLERKADSWTGFLDGLTPPPAG